MESLPHHHCGWPSAFQCSLSLTPWILDKSWQKGLSSNETQISGWEQMHTQLISGRSSKALLCLFCPSITVLPHKWWCNKAWNAYRLERKERQAAVEIWRRCYTPTPATHPFILLLSFKARKREGEACQEPPPSPSLIIWFRARRESESSRECHFCWPLALLLLGVNWGGKEEGPRACNGRVIFTAGDKRSPGQCWSTHCLMPGGRRWVERMDHGTWSYVP